MIARHCVRRAFFVLSGIILSGTLVCNGFAATRALRGHVPAVVRSLRALGGLPATNRLSLSIGLPLRDPAGLKRFLHDVYDPASPQFHKYISSETFATQWGPTEEDYAAVKRFAESNGLTVTHNHKNRMLLDVTGTTPVVEKAFHVSLQMYQHPTENRRFFAPATDPRVEAGLPVLDVEGLNNYSIPHRAGRSRHPVSGAGVIPMAGNSGSGAIGTYLAADLRAAYVPGVALDGSGQTVALVSYDGYYPSDIAAYEQTNHLPAVVLTNVLIDGASGKPLSSGLGTDVINEDSLDIEMVIAMAPKVSRIIVYEGVNGFGGVNLIPHANDLLNQIATDNLAREVSSSYASDGGTTGLAGADLTTDQIFQEMAAQGQSFFQASGDWGAYLADYAGEHYTLNHGDAPFLSSPYVTLVGGTTLDTFGAGGAWSNEVAWNWKQSGLGTLSTSGTISTTYPIPSWQQTVDMSANGGSTLMRNTPDVACLADEIFVYANGKAVIMAGTSAAAPLWAGFMALVNEQAESHGQPPAGFINPAIYRIGQGAKYHDCFHDITLGNNTNTYSPTNFLAVNGYDLCTGWGTPAGQPLIDALADPDMLIITPGAGFTTANGPAGPFNITNETFVLTNTGAAAVSWSAGGVPPWLKVSNMMGSLAAGGTAAVAVGLNEGAAALADGVYDATIWFTNNASGFVQGREFVAKVRQPLVTNGGFETGDFSGWTALGWWWDARFTEIDNTFVGDGPHSGQYYADFWPHYVSGVFSPDPFLPTFLSQKIPTVPGQVYQISFWGSGAHTFTEFTTSWGENILSDLIFTNTSGLQWSNFVIFAVAKDTETKLEFGLHGMFYLDDVTVTLASNVAPVINQQPAPAFPEAGKSAALSVLAAGSGALTYNWRHDGNDMNDNGQVSGSASSTLHFATVTASDRGNYDVVISNAYGAVTSVPALFQPVGPSVLADGGFEAPSITPNASLTATPAGWTGTGILINGAPFAGDSPHATPEGPGPLDFVEVGPPPEEGNQYICLAGYAGASSVAHGFAITAAGEYWVGWHDNDLVENGSYLHATYAVSIFDGSNNVVTNLAFDSYNLNTVQPLVWQEKSMLATLAAGLYTLQFDQPAGDYNPLDNNPWALLDGVSIRPILSAAVSPEILQDPVSQAVKIGQGATFEVVAGGTSPLTYQWRSAGGDLTDGARISGAATNTLQLRPTFPADASSYSVVVSNAFGAVTSAWAGLTLTAPPLLIASAPSDSNLTFGMEAFAGLSYQLQGSTELVSNSWLDVGAPTPATEGMIYLYDNAGTNRWRFYRVKVLSP